MLKYVHFIHSTLSIPSYRSSSTLLGAKVKLFSNGYYQYGIDIDCRPSGPQMLFAAKNHDDRWDSLSLFPPLFPPSLTLHCRIRFVNDVHEAILECAQMEAVRLEMEFGKQHPGCKSGMNGGMIAVNVPKVDKNNEDDSSRYTFVPPLFLILISFNLKSRVVIEWILNVILEYPTYWLMN